MSASAFNAHVKLNESYVSFVTFDHYSNEPTRLTLPRGNKINIWWTVPEFQYQSLSTDHDIARRGRGGEPNVSLERRYFRINKTVKSLIYRESDTLRGECLPLIYHPLVVM